MIREMLRDPRNLSNRRKLLLSVLVLSVFSTLANAGTYALYTTSSASPNNVFSTGSVSLSNSSGGSATVQLANMAPGDSVAGLVTVTNNGGEDVTAYTFVSSVAGASPNPNALFTDTTNGLHLDIERCSQPWSGTAPNFVCAGVQSHLVGTPSSPVPVVQGGRSLAPNAFCATNAVAAAERAARGVSCSLTSHDYLEVTVSLPATANNALQGLSGSINLTFSGQQPSGANF